MLGKVKVPTTVSMYSDFGARVIVATLLAALRGASVMSAWLVRANAR